MTKIREIFSKNREIIMYIFIGICTTLVNFILYTVLYYIFKIEVNISNVIAILASILFAYFANKLFVFKSKKEGLKDNCKEILAFFSARFLTMALEIFGVYLTVTILGQNELLGKLEMQVIVQVANYLLSKFIIFKKQR